MAASTQQSNIIDRLTAEGASERVESAQAPPHANPGDPAGSAQAPQPGTEGHHQERSAQAPSPEVIAAVLRHLAAGHGQPETSAQARSPAPDGEAGDTRAQNWWNQGVDGLHRNDPWAAPAAQPAPAAPAEQSQEHSWG